jgi:hypothetical protein
MPPDFEDRGPTTGCGLIWNTQGNRAALRALGPAIDRSFPIPGKRAIELLGAGADPGGSALIVL